MQTVMRNLQESHPKSIVAGFLKDNCRYSTDGGRINFAFLSDATLEINLGNTRVDNCLHSEIFHREVVDIVRYLNNTSTMVDLNITVDDGSGVEREIKKNTQGGTPIVAGNTGFPCSYHDVEVLITEV